MSIEIHLGPKQTKLEAMTTQIIQNGVKTCMTLQRCYFIVKKEG